MELNNYINLAFKRKQEFVYNTCSMYKFIKKTSNVLEGFGEANHKVTSVFEVFMQTLSQDEKTVLQCEFMENRTSSWYEEYFSKTRYYKAKHDLVDNFIRRMVA